MILAIEAWAAQPDRRPKSVSRDDEAAAHAEAVCWRKFERERTESDMGTERNGGPSWHGQIHSGTMIATFGASKTVACLYLPAVRPSDGRVSRVAARRQGKQGAAAPGCVAKYHRQRQSGLRHVFKYDRITRNADQSEQQCKSRRHRGFLKAACLYY